MVYDELMAKKKSGTTARTIKLQKYVDTRLWDEVIAKHGPPADQSALIEAGLYQVLLADTDGVKAMAKAVVEWKERNRPRVSRGGAPTTPDDLEAESKKKPGRGGDR